MASGTLDVFYWDELQTPSPFSLANRMDTASSTVSLAQMATPFIGEVLQVGTELMSVVSVNSASNTYSVARQAFGTSASEHNVNDSVLFLDASAVVLPFSTNFFDNKSSINYLHTFNLPDVRICAAQFYVTNAFGDSQTRQVAYTSGTDGGLRTLSGGQFSIQVSGYLATQQNAAPPLLIQATHAVRDIRAAVGQAPAGYDIAIDLLQNGVLFCSVLIQDGESNSTLPPINGVVLPPLTALDTLIINVTLTATSQTPINPGRDLTLTVRF